MGIFPLYMLELEWGTRQQLGNKSAQIHYTFINDLGLLPEDKNNTASMPIKCTRMQREI